LTVAETKREYWPALDGVRGLAILLVVAGHATLLVGPTGGQIGVTVFFVLSGFLITSILSSELESTGKVSFGNFYRRRAARLLPALFAYVGISALLVSRFASGSQIWNASWPALAYTANYAQILGVDMGHNPHTWSLAVEEHFYFLWPAICVHFKAFRRPKILMGGVVVLVGLRFAVGLFDPFWAYHGTFTNGFALLLGCALAAAYRDRSGVSLPRGTAEVAAIGLFLLGNASLWWFGISGTESLPEVGIWLPVVAAALAGLMIWDLAARSSRSYFETPWLMHAGRISYGWYLWHAPFMFIAALNSTPEKRLLWMVVSFVIAEVSWRFLEAPILRRARRRIQSPSPERTGVRP
jgi:peptidoglycan/LPS O-acetylase OafA/YrhL